MGKLPSIKSLKKEVLNLWKDVCFLRDGRNCQVQKFYPTLSISHSEVYQVDHCISRSDKNLFFEPSNGTVVCSTCNRLKHFQSKNVHRLIDSIVINREGLERFKEMQEINQHHKPNLYFSKRFWLEAQKEKLLNIKNNLLLSQQNPYEQYYDASNTVLMDLRPYD